MSKTQYTEQSHGRKLLTESEAASQLSLAVTTLRRWRWAGRGPRFIKVGWAVRYDVSDIEKYLDDGRRRSTSDPGAKM